MRSPRALASGATVASIWRASSRVGAKIMARGAFGRRSLDASANRVSTGRAKAKVFPDPVRPRPRTSRPAMESTKVATWIGKGRSIPCRSRTAQSATGTPSSAKVGTASSCAWGADGVGRVDDGMMRDSSVMSYGHLLASPLRKQRGFEDLQRGAPRWGTTPSLGAHRPQPGRDDQEVALLRVDGTR